MMDRGCSKTSVLERQALLARQPLKNVVLQGFSLWLLSHKNYKDKGPVLFHQTGASHRAPGYDGSV
jgi:hypothetical protein